MKKPNFFIIGAPKCGTTSMANWLGAHPAIFMSRIKEPHYFNKDHPEHCFVNSFAEYQRLFQGASEQHIAVGEASAGYLYFKESVPNILDFNPDARFIVMVRNPVDMAYSMHGQRCLGTELQSRDFATEWKFQEAQEKAYAAGLTSKRPRLPPYAKMCLLGAQVQQLFRVAPRERIHIIVFDDLREDAQREYSRVLDFLEVPNDGRQAFPVFNEAKELRFVFVARVMNRLAQAKRKLSFKRSLGVGRVLLPYTMRPKQRPPLSLETREMLISYFSKDVELLGKLIDRDLSAWLE